MRRSSAWLGLVALLAVPALMGVAARPLYAQQDPPEQAQRDRGRDDRHEKARPAALLPPPSRTEHALELDGRTLRFTATAGAIPIPNSAGRTLAEIAYVAYTLDGADPRRRPVTFAFNGGPGAASAWLHIGAIGPWRLPLAAASAAPAAPPALVPNAETWLDFTDLVFIDPVGSGLSHILGESEEAGGRSAKRGSRRSAPEPASREEGGPRYFWSIDGDVESLADFIQEWLKRTDRLASPKMLVGESYGGFRAPKIVHLLQRQRGIAVNAMVLVSPVLDFEGRRVARHSPTSYVSLLPSLAAAALERQGKVPTRELLSEVEAYARSDYLVDLLRGPRDQAAVDRIVAKVAEFTRLPEEAVRRHGGRLSSRAYVQEAVRPKQRVASFYDVTVTGLDPDPGSASARFDDPFTTALAAPMTGAMLELLNTRLQWRTGRTYHLLSRRANRAWIWGNSPNPPEAVSALKEVLSLDARFQVLVTHGFTDLVTPYTASAILLDQLPAYGDPPRVSSEVYPGGHMFYSRDGSRAAFRRDAEKLLARSLQPQGT